MRPEAAASSSLPLKRLGLMRLIRQLVVLVRFLVDSIRKILKPVGRWKNEGGDSPGGAEDINEALTRGLDPIDESLRQQREQGVRKNVGVGSRWSPTWDQ